MKTKVLVLLSLLIAYTAGSKFEFLEEWTSWKSDHGKIYSSEREEIGRHLVWLSNKAYIDGHNANSQYFGHTLAMNHFGDLVSADYYIIIAACTSKSTMYGRPVFVTGAIGVQKCTMARQLPQIPPLC